MSWEVLWGWREEGEGEKKGNEPCGVDLMERSVEWCCIGWEGAEMREN